MKILNLLEDFHKGRNRNVPCPCGSGIKAKQCECNISKTAKQNVINMVYSDVNEAVMQDAENFAKENLEGIKDEVQRIFATS